MPNDAIAPIDPEELGLIPVPNESSVVKPYCMSHGTVLCKDLRKTRRFYEEFLGLEVARHAEGAMVFRCGLKFHVACVQRGEEIVPSGRHNHWGLDVRSVEEVDRIYKAAVEMTGKYGIRHIEQPRQQRGVYSFFLEDADYNWWEIQFYDGFQNEDLFDFGDRYPMDADLVQGPAVA
jgi:catechol 2,3-dioxygenase-like lactoylglutathione lyase family enzyme